MSPIQRLETLLKRAVKTPRLQEGSGIVLADLLGLEPLADRRNWSRAYLELTDLVAAAREYAAAMVPDFDGSPHATTFTELDRIVSGVNLEITWNSYTQQFNHIATIALPFMVHATDGRGAPPALKSEVLEELRRDLDALLDKIIKSNLDATFKRELARDVEALRSSIVRVHVGGGEAIVHAAAQVVGAVAVYEGSAKKNPEVVKNIFDLISKIQDTIIKAAKIGALGHGVWKMLHPGS